MTYRSTEAVTLTDRQRRIFEEIAKFRAAHPYGPTLRDIKGRAGISSSSVVEYNVSVLERLGLVDRERGIARTIRVTDAGREYIAAGAA